MSKTGWRLLMLGGGSEADCFHLPVLYETAMTHMRRELPENWTAEYVSDGRLNGETADGADFVLLCTAALPAIQREDYERIVRAGECVLTADGTTVGAAVSAERLARHPQSMDELISALSERNEISVEYAVRTARDAQRAQAVMRERIAERLSENGVCIFDWNACWISADAVIGAGTTILPGTMIEPGCVIGAGCTIGPNTVLRRTKIGDRTTVNASQISDSTVGEDTEIGPFAYIRPNCTVGSRVKVGDFVELKNCTIGDDTKASHLTYVGDADIGQRVNFGCGTVVVNYDGYDKHRTTVGDDCFIGCNTNLVAPITIGDRVLTAAGSTVTESVGDGALAIARARQQTRPGWNDRRRAEHGQSTGRK